MVTDKPGYEQLILFLSENLGLFATPGAPGNKTVLQCIEEQIAEQIINLCMQHQELEVNHRSVIVREVDGIVYDLQEVLGGVLEQPTNNMQREFIEEFAGLVKNLFDSQIADLMK